MNHCLFCHLYSVDRRLVTKMVSGKELDNPDFTIYARRFSSSLGIGAEDWVERLADMYRDYGGLIINGEGHAISLNTEHLEVGREWYRDWANTPVPGGVRPRIHGRSRARIRVFLTILRLKYPREAMAWDMRADNDNQRAKEGRQRS